MNKKNEVKKKQVQKKNYFFTSLCVPQTLDQHSSSCIKGRGIFLVIANVEARILAEVFMKQGTKLERWWNESMSGTISFRGCRNEKSVSCSFKVRDLMFKYEQA